MGAPGACGRRPRKSAATRAPDPRVAGPELRPRGPPPIRSIGPCRISRGSRRPFGRRRPGPPARRGRDRRRSARLGPVRPSGAARSSRAHVTCTPVGAPPTSAAMARAQRTFGTARSRRIDANRRPERVAAARSRPVRLPAGRSSRAPRRSSGRRGAGGARPHRVHVVRCDDRHRLDDAGKPRLARGPRRERRHETLSTPTARRPRLPPSPVQGPPRHARPLPRFCRPVTATPAEPTSVCRSSGDRSGRMRPRSRHEDGPRRGQARTPRAPRPRS